MQTNDATRHSTRWCVSWATIGTWSSTGARQYQLLKSGAAARVAADDRCSPIKSLSLHCQAQGVFIKDVVEASGLTKQTLNRLAKHRNTHRLRDLVAGTAVLVAARNRSKVYGH